MARRARKPSPPPAEHRADVRLIGIDCATAVANTGIAIADLDRTTRRIRIVEARCCQRGDELAALALAGAGDGPALLALDAPLGWPGPLGDALSWHQAGAPLGSPVLPDDRMFSRVTDLEVRARFGKRPLEVGADRIARTARAALRLLADLEVRRNKVVPLAWTPGTVEGVQAIEVYPAATLVSRRIAAKGYRQHASRRRAVLRALSGTLLLPRGLDRTLCASPHALDALVCVVAAADFALGEPMRAPAVDQIALSRREGWIWVRDPSA